MTTAKAIYSFEATSEVELSFEEGDTLIVKVDDGDWLEATHAITKKVFMFYELSSKMERPDLFLEIMLKLFYVKRPMDIPTFPPILQVQKALQEILILELFN
jgi:hypothetical protein